MMSGSIEERHFIEDIGLYFEHLGMPRMAGRVLGILLISDPPAQSINDLCQVLLASKGSISMTTRLLAEAGLIEKVPAPMPRRDYYRFKPGGWTHFLRQRTELMSALHQIAERGLELIKDKDASLKQRLLEAHDIFSFIEEMLPEIQLRWQAHKQKLQSARAKEEQIKNGRALQ